MNRPNDNGQPSHAQTRTKNGRRSPSDPSASTEAADHLTVLAHELGTMIDGSLRGLGMISDTLDPGDAPARDQIQSVQSMLERMSGLVGAAMRSRTLPLGSPLLGEGVAVSLGEAIDHALDVVGAMAAAHGVRTSVHIQREAGRTTAGPLYAVIHNALCNAIESIARCEASEDPPTGGTVCVSARIVEDMGMRWVQVDVEDDGHGLPAGGDREWPFRHGFSIKAEGGGVGLSVARQLVHEAGGSVELLDREGAPSKADRPGAVLRIRCPYRAAGEPVTGG